MSSDPSQYPVVNNTERRRFELQVEGKTAVAEYIKTPQKLFLTHTEVPKGLEGKGIASQNKALKFLSFSQIFTFAPTKRFFQENI